MEIKENELKQQEQFHGTLLQQQQQAIKSTLSEMLKTEQNMAAELHNSCQFTSVFPHVYVIG